MRTPSDWTPKQEMSPAGGSGGKALKFAVVMIGATAALGFLIGGLMPPPVRGNAGATPPRVNMAVPTKSTPQAVNNSRVYRADGSGHFFVDAAVNGVEIRFLVDTGATVVALTRDDARAIGLSDGDLRFSDAMSTANGQALAARTTLRSIRVDQFETADVPAVVMEKNMAVSLLGMSFLSRLAAYSISGGELTIEW